eukprot:m.86167 g.86167  ORF g.86167 m.86167 type:complete len:638 (-) comp13046_c0_seq2:86-1999(-)
MPGNGVREVLEEQQRYQTNIEAKLKKAVNEDSAVLEVSKVLKKLETLESRYESLIKNKEREDKKFEDVGVQISSGCQEVEELTKVHTYLRWVTEINRISDAIGSDQEEYSDHLQELISLITRLKGTSCEKLYCYAQGTLARWEHKLLFRPLYARFEYHFLGKHETNDPRKPRYMLTWASRKIEDFLNTTGKAVQIDTKVRLVQGFTGMLRKKLEIDLAGLEDNDDDNLCLCNAARDMLTYDQEICDICEEENGDINYEDLLVSNVIIENDTLCERWLDTEYRLSGEKYDACMEAPQTLWSMLGTPDDINSDELEVARNNVWKVGAFSDIQALDDMRVPLATEGILTLLESCIDFAESIPKPHKNIIQHIVDNIVMKIFEVFRDAIEDALTSSVSKRDNDQLISLLNSSWYICSAMELWKETNLFSESSTSEKFKNELKLYETLKTNISNEIAELATRQAKGLLKSYSKQIIGREPKRNVVAQELTISVAKVSADIHYYLSQLKSQVALNLQANLWKQMAAIFDDMIVQDLCLSDGMDRSMIDCLSFDLEEGFFKSFSLVSSLPNSLFPKLYETFLLLKLDIGTWARLKGLLSMTTGLLEQTAELKKVGVYTLTREVAAHILDLHTDHIIATKMAAKQ